MRWPESVNVPDRIVTAVNNWMAKLSKEYGFIIGDYLEEDASGMSSLVVCVTGSGLGDLYSFHYKTFEAAACIDDDDELIFKEI